MDYVNRYVELKDEVLFKKMKKKNKLNFKKSNL